MMRDRDHLYFLLPGSSREEFVPQFPRGHFQRQLRFRGKRLHVRAFSKGWQLQRGGSFADKAFIGVTGAPAQPVIEVRNGNPPVMFLGEHVENTQQNHRIHAAGNGDEDFLAAQKQAAALNLVFDALKELAHAFILLFPGAAGKRPDYSASLSR